MSHYFLTNSISQLITVKFWAEFIIHFCFISVETIKANNIYIFCKMEKTEFRAIIKHLHMKDLMPKEIKAELDNVHSTSAPTFVSVYNWMNEFKRGTSTCEHLVRNVQLRLLHQKSSIKSTIVLFCIVLIDE